MEDKNIIIILIAIIVILVAVLGMVILHQEDSQEPTKIKIISNKTIYEGEDLSIKLTDLNKTPLSKKTVNITIYNNKGKIVVNEVVKTNSKGKAKLNLDLDKGKYTVNVTFDGDENYSANSTTKKIEIIEEEIVETPPEEITSTTEEISSTPQTTEYDSYSQDDVQVEVLENWDGNPENLPYPVRAEDDWHGMRM